MGLGSGVLLVVVGLVLLTGVVDGVAGFDSTSLGATALGVGVLTIAVALVVHRRRTRLDTPPVADR